MSTAEDSSPLDDSIILNALRAGLTLAGFDVGALELIRVANNYIYADRPNRTIYRVSVAPRLAEDLTAENNRLTKLARAGAPILAPRQDDPIALSTGHLATVWPLGQDPDPNPVLSLAPALGELHRVEPVDGLPVWEGFQRFHRRVATARSIGVPESLVEEVDGRLRQLEDGFPPWSTGTVVHGDPHLGNLVNTDQGNRLIDLDDLAVGCPEIDLATVRNVYLRFEGVPGSWDAFSTSYGHPFESGLIDHFVKVRELTMIAWLFSLWNLRPETRPETTNRVSTIDQTTVWNAL